MFGSSNRLACDLKKTMKDGKPIIIEGMHVDPNIYLIDEERKSPHKASKTYAEISKTEAIGEELDKLSDGVKSVHIVNHAAADNKPILKREKSGVTEPVIIPIVLKMAEFDHKALLEEWISSRTFSDKYPIKEKDKVISNLKTIQDYLCSFKSHGLTVANISATTTDDTLSFYWFH